MPWKFNVVPDGFWNDIKNVRNYFDWLGNELKIENMDGWYKVTSKVSKKILKILKKFLKNNSTFFRISRQNLKLNFDLGFL